MEQMTAESITLDLHSTFTAKPGLDKDRCQLQTVPLARSKWPADTSPVAVLLLPSLICEPPSGCQTPRPFPTTLQITLCCFLDGLLALLLLLRSQLYLGFAILLLLRPLLYLGFAILLLLRSQLYLGFAILLLLLRSLLYLGFAILLLLLRLQLYICGSPFFFFFCVPCCIWGSPFFFFFCVSSYTSAVHQSSSSSAFPNYTSAVHQSSSSSAFPNYTSAVHQSSSSPSPAVSRVHHSSSSFASLTLKYRAAVLALNFAV